MRRASAVGAAMVLCAVALLAAHTQGAAADPDPCVRGRIVSQCAAVAQRTPPPPTTRTSSGGGSQIGSRGRAAAWRAAPLTELQRQELTVRINVQRIGYARCLARAQINRGDPSGCAAPPAPPAPRAAPAASPPTITPAQAGAIAVARLRLPASAPGIGPDPAKNEWQMAAIGYPLWLWVDGPTHIGPVGEDIGGLSVSLDARVSHTMIRMGDGHTVTCRGGGTPYKAWVQPGAKSPTCGYTYQRPSLPRGEYTVTAIAYWEVTWRVNGASGVQTVPMAGTRRLPVGELQAVIVH